jgi:23S rRNA (guanosine2251-2'-O)-methyltransferase
MSNDESGKRPGGFRRNNERPTGGQRGGFPRSGGNFRRDNERPREGYPRGGDARRESGGRSFHAPRPPRSGYDARDQRSDRPFAGREGQGEWNQSGEGRGNWERPSFGDRDRGGDRPDRPSFEQRRLEGDRPERPPFQGRDRRPFSADQERPPFEPRADRGDRPSFGNRDRRPPFENQDRRPFGERQAGDRPSFGGSRRDEFHALDEDGNDQDRRPNGDRPAFNSRWRDGDRPSFGGSRPGGDRPGYGGPRSGGDRPGGDRPGFGGPRPGGDRPPFSGRRPGGDRPSFGGDRPAYGGPRSGGDRPSYQGSRPFEQRPERPPFEGQGRPLGTSTRMGRPPVNQFEPVKADVYGRWPVLESLRAGNVVKVYLAAGVHDSADHLREIQTMAAEKHIPVVRVERFALDKVLGNANHQGIAAACRPYEYVDLDRVVEGAKKGEGQPLVLLFDGIQDPQNLGSILRTAEAVGVGGAILPRHNQVGVTPSVVRASAGAVEHLPIAEVTNLRQTVARLKEAGYWIVGLDMEGGTDYDNFDVENPIALVIGGEGKGLSRLVTEECDYLVRLPMRGKVGSLNASVAAGIVLYEIERRRGITNPARRAKARPDAGEEVVSPLPAPLPVGDALDDEEDLAPYVEMAADDEEGLSPYPGMVADDELTGDEEEAGDEFEDLEEMELEEAEIEEAELEELDKAESTPVESAEEKSESVEPEAE